MDILDISTACNSWVKVCCRRAVWPHICASLEADTRKRCDFVKRSSRLGICGLCHENAGNFGLICTSCTRHRLVWGPVHGFILADIQNPPVPLAVAGWHAGKPLHPVYDRLELRSAMLSNPDAQTLGRPRLLTGDAQQRWVGTIHNLTCSFGPHVQTLSC